MTNDDELLRRLDNHGRWWAVGDARSEDNAAACDEAADRIRELEAERDEAVTQMIEAKLANKGVAEGTHVIVPVDQPSIPDLPNDMQEFADRHGLGTFLQELWRQAFRTAHRAMIRAAQGSTGGVSSTPEQEGSP